MKVADFQLTCYGAAPGCRVPGESGTPSDVRRGHDRALLREYLAELARHG